MLEALVQIFDDDARLSVEPAAIVPVLAPVPPGLRVTVLPLEVVEVVGRVVVLGRVVVPGRVVVVVVRVVVVVVGVVVFVDAAGIVPPAAGTSESVGCAVVSRLAS